MVVILLGFFDLVRIWRGKSYVGCMFFFLLYVYLKRKKQVVVYLFFFLIVSLEEEAMCVFSLWENEEQKAGRGDVCGLG